MQRRLKKASAAPSPGPGCSPQEPSALLLVSRFLRPGSPFPHEFVGFGKGSRCGKFVATFLKKKDKNLHSDKFLFRSTLIRQHAPLRRSFCHRGLCRGLLGPVRLHGQWPQDPGSCSCRAARDAQRVRVACAQQTRNTKRRARLSGRKRCWVRGGCYTTRCVRGGALPPLSPACPQLVCSQCRVDGEGLVHLREPARCCRHVGWNARDCTSKLWHLDRDC
jgi:hypothetical protein